MPRGQAVAVGGSAKQTDKTIVFLLKKVRPLHVKYYLELEKLFVYVSVYGRRFEDFASITRVTERNAGVALAPKCRRVVYSRGR